MVITKKKMALILLWGFLLVNGTRGMTLFIPPEIFIGNNTLELALQSDSEEHNQVRVIKENAVIRIKPKKDAVIIKKLPLGVLLEVDTEIGDWLKITLPPDEDGFILTGYLLRSFTEEGSIIHQ